MRLDCAGRAVTGAGANRAIELIDRSGVTMRNCVVTGGSVGIHLHGSNGNTIANNVVTNSWLMGVGFWE